MLDDVQASRLPHREERLKVALPAQIRIDCTWEEACILNLSPHGLLVYSQLHARPGGMVEVRRGEQSIVARVQWRRHNRIGLQSLRLLHLGEVIAGTSPAAPLLARPDELLAEQPLPLPTQQAGRAHSPMLQITMMVLIGMVFAGASYSTTISSLSEPVERFVAGVGHHRS